MKPLKTIFDCVDFCIKHDVCDGCPCGLTFEKCDIDHDVLAYLRQLQSEHEGLKKE